MSVPPDYPAEMASQKPLNAQLRPEVLRRNLVRVVLRRRRGAPASSSGRKASPAISVGGKDLDNFGNLLMKEFYKTLPGRDRRAADGGERQEFLPWGRMKCSCRAVYEPSP